MGVGDQYFLVIWGRAPPPLPENTWLRPWTSVNKLSFQQFYENIMIFKKAEVS